MRSVIWYFIKAITGGLLLAALLLVILRTPISSLFNDFSSPVREWNTQAESYANAVKRAAPAVVNIYTRSLQNDNKWDQLATVRTGLGSGVIMSKSGHILTNAHVINGADQIIVVLQDGRIYNAELIGTDVYTDLAVLFIEAQNLPVIPQNPELSTRVGDVVLAIGNPYNLGQTITQGIISATGRSGISTSYQDFLQTDAAINRGNSGGALINSRGVLVGINTAAAFRQNNPNDDIYGINFAIPYHLAQKIMQKLIKDGKIVRGYLGIGALRLSPHMASQNRLPVQQGIIVDDVSKGGPAERAGLQKNDIILKINNKAVEGPHGAMDTIAETPPGTRITLTIMRQGRLLEIPVVVSEPPPPHSQTNLGPGR